MPAANSISCPGLLASLAALMPIAAFAQPNAKPDPTHADVAYAEHPRNRLDFWKAESERPTPLVIYIHGGGFRAGSKDSLNARTLKRLLAAGISVAALEYRLISDAPLPAAHYDCRRAVQFLRSKAGEWNIDKTRVGAFGGSAGAQLCMYLGFHDDAADPESNDALARESTRLACVATHGGQTTMDVNWWLDNIPGYNRPHRDFRAGFGAQTDEELRERAAQVSALALISRDDPPIYMAYAMAPDDPVPDEESGRPQGWKVHHVNFGIALKRRMDELGVEAHLRYPGTRPAYPSEVEFFMAKLAAGAERDDRD
jgi:acetyl esterase/lipase